MIVESVAEDFDIKVALLRKVAASTEAAIIATNTSSLSVTDLANASGTSRRLIGTHYWNPPSLMPLVEVIPGRGTDPAIASSMLATLRAIGKRPVPAPDIPGFIWNRLQFALLREAVGLVNRHGVAPETIDQILREGLGRRWSAIGPFETIALGGPDIFAAVAQGLLPQLISDLQPGEFTTVRLPRDAALDHARQSRDHKLAEFLRQDRHRANRT